MTTNAAIKNNEKLNYEKDGMCWGNAIQQRECKNYLKYHDSIYTFCKWQGLGMTCDFGDDE